jgi:hypothetical protein
MKAVPVSDAQFLTAEGAGLSRNELGQSPAVRHAELT